MTGMASSRYPVYSAGQLRRELSLLNRQRARIHPHEHSFGSVPSFVFQESEAGHGNFHPDSYRAIQAHPEWSRRLAKAYTAGKWIPRRHDRTRRELDCANSSDALLMNIFCHPATLTSQATGALLGISRIEVDQGIHPIFGFKPHTPTLNPRTNRKSIDQTEIDMSLGPLLVEAKLTETGFQTAPLERAQRYPGFAEIFDIEDLPVVEATLHSWQLVRGTLAAHYLNRSFAVLCDARRADLIERWYRVIRAVRNCDLRSRLALLTWQELTSTLPSSLQVFLREKYGIQPQPHSR
jgi:hypothetical protein